MTRSNQGDDLLKKPLTVLKFGGSVLRDEADTAEAVHEIYRYLRRGSRVLAVVSALGETTDGLLAKARHLCEEPDPRTLAGLLATGESTSAAFLALACQRAGLPARVIEPQAVGLRAEGPLLDARPTDLDLAAIAAEFALAPVLILPGFVGHTEHGDAALFGRGGTDLTALFVAHRLKAERCRLIKDVEGLYDRDPALPGPVPGRFVSLSWDEALALGGGVLQPKALRYAREVRLNFTVGGLGSPRETRVGDEARLCLPPETHAQPLRIVLLGLGHVGWGVYRALSARPDLFEVARILVRDPAKHQDRLVSQEQLTTDAAQALNTPCDVVVELLGGVHPAGDWIAQALQSGRHVVSANKAALAERGQELAAIARAKGVRLCYSASVGGALPALEAVRRAALHGLVSFEGVLNGTTNFVLDRLAEGKSHAAAVQEAQRRGFAEADPTLDLDGTDVRQKLELLACAAFPKESAGKPWDRRIEWVRTEGIDAIPAEQVQEAWAAGQRTRLVGRVEKRDGVLLGSIEIRILKKDEALAKLRNEENGLILKHADGHSEYLRGAGAGCWPTTEAVLSDLFELVRSHTALAGRPVQPSTREQDTAIRGKGEQA